MDPTFDQRLAQVRERIARSCEKANRDPSAVTIIAVTKRHPADTIAMAVEAGVADIGENRVQEALEKLPQVPAAARIHLIGQLQSNKVNKAVGRFASIASVDRDALLTRIASRAAELEVDQSVWIQVNITNEPQKGGCDPSMASDLWHRALEAARVTPQGVMAMARHAASEAELRRDFARVRELAATWRTAAGEPAALSMGMSGDFEVAIEEGATHVRLGTVLFGPRPV